MFLTDQGQVFSCGLMEWTGLNDSLMKLYKPCQIPALEQIKIVDIGVGSEHVLAGKNCPFFTLNLSITFEMYRFYFCFYSF